MIELQRIRWYNPKSESFEWREVPKSDEEALSLLRGCADRSWSAGRSAFPSVAHPAFSNPPPHDDHHLRERHPEIDHPPYPLRTPHQFLVRVMPRVRPLRHPTLPGA